MTATTKRLPWYEFFAGGGMARLGTAAPWECVFANDRCHKKAAAYKTYFGGTELRVCDVAKLTPSDLPGTPALVWASFPCQDLSVAGNGAGLKGKRSGTFRPFWKLIHGTIRLGRIPRLIVLENVIGTLTSSQGQDFVEIVRALVDDGYLVGALVMDAVRFLPQSRPRLFVVAFHSRAAAPAHCIAPEAPDIWRPATLRATFERLPGSLRDRWVWWRLPAPTAPVPAFHTILEDDPAGVDWHSQETTERLIGLMSPLHRERLKQAQESGGRIAGTVYRRTRADGKGGIAQKAEIRFDQIAGCLRTPGGGSSRQTLFVVEGRQVRSRLLSPREVARLMGVPDEYPLPSNYNAAYHLFGDGVAVPVVRWLSVHLLTPLADC